MKRLPDLQQLKQQLVQHYLWLRQYGCNDSHSGNASFRWHDEVWVTPSGCCADTLTVDDLVRCQLDGIKEEGASLDAALHIEVYRENPATRAVFHSHGPYAVAMTLNGESFEPVDFEGQYYFPTVPVVKIPYQDYVEKSPKAVANELKTHKVMVVCGHGLYAGAESINQAYKWICSLELSAKTAWLAQQI
ncbi:class II aldolase/adducin family protein [Methylophaga sp.]|uniref:class II aldolase/adducin family protein n=1 Tax=Methylophaga sp. TaxID=2024840 RepID=UPI003F6A501C